MPQEGHGDGGARATAASGPGARRRRGTSGAAGLRRAPGAGPPLGTDSADATEMTDWTFAIVRFGAGKLIFGSEMSGPNVASKVASQMAPTRRR